MAGGGWVQRARLDASAPALLYNGTALTDIALDLQVFVYGYRESVFIPRVILHSLINLNVHRRSTCTGRTRGT